jgi:hypothetical protein
LAQITGFAGVWTQVRTPAASNGERESCAASGSDYERRPITSCQVERRYLWNVGTFPYSALMFLRRVGHCRDLGQVFDHEGGLSA